MLYRHFFRRKVISGIALYISSGVLAPITTEAQTPLNSGAEITAALAAGGTDLYTFEAELGNRYFLTIGELFDTVDVPNFSPRLTVESPGGSELNINALLVSRQAVATGKHTVKVRNNEAFGGVAGNYVLRFIKIPGLFIVPDGDQGGTLASGEEIEGSVFRDDLDAWTFAVPAGSYALLSLRESAANPDYNPVLWVYNGRGEAVFTNGNASRVRYWANPAQDETYTAIVQGGTLNTSAVGDYVISLLTVPGSFTVPPGDEGGPLTNGVRHEGTLTVGDIDVWSFEAAVGDVVILNATASGDPPVDLDWKPEISVLDPLGSFAAVTNPQNLADIVFVATRAGQYTVIVADNNTQTPLVGAYRLHFSRAPALLGVPPNDEGGAILNGERKSGFLTPGDIDAWTFTATAGDYLAVGLGHPDSLPGNGDYSPALVLVGPNGTIIQQTSNDALAFIGVTAPATGTYTAFATAAQGRVNATSPYEFHLAKAPGNPVVPVGDEGGPITNGGFGAGTLAAGDIDSWYFDANAGSYAVIQLANESGNAVPAFHPRAELIGPDGTIFATLDTDSSPVARFTFTAQAAGRHQIIVHDVPTSTAAMGNYRVHLAQAPLAIGALAEDEGGTLLSGETRRATLTVGDVDPWQIRAQAGQVIVVNIAIDPDAVNVAPYQPRVELRASDGSFVVPELSNTADQTLIGRRITRTGLYTAIVSNEFITGSGGYGISAVAFTPGQVNDFEDDGGTIPNGSRVHGTIGAPGDLDLWWFAGLQDSVTTVNLIESVPGSALIPRLWYWAPDGYLREGSQHASATGVVATPYQEGIYTFIASSASNATGDYEFERASLGVPFTVPTGDEGGPITLGVTHNGVITPGDVDLWTVAATAGDVLKVIFNVVPPDPNNGLADPIYGPDFALLHGYRPNQPPGGPPIDPNELDFNVLVTGLHTIVIRGQVAVGTGTYQLHVEGATFTGAPPVIVASPAPLETIVGAALRLEAQATGSNLTYQWRRNGADIPGATSSVLEVASAQLFHSGAYRVVVSNASGVVTSEFFTVRVDAATTSASRVLNLSTRALVQTGDNVLIPGFVIGGSAKKRLLIRAVGPTLNDPPINFVGPTLPNPRMTVRRYDFATNSYLDVATNDDWHTNANADEILQVGLSLGAFSLTQPFESAFLLDLDPGQYTVITDDAAGASGIAIVELYDADDPATDSRLINISNRGFVGTGANVMIPGFVVSPEGPKTFLIRAVGPTLAMAPYNVPGTMADPKLTVYQTDPTNGLSIEIYSQENWPGYIGGEYVPAVAAQVGAFPLSSGTTDDAIVLTLPPGIYTAIGSSADGISTGVVLVEIYIVE